MTQSKFITERGQTVTIEEKLASIPYGWSGHIDVSGVEEREGHILNRPEFFGGIFI